MGMRLNQADIEELSKIYRRVPGGVERVLAAQQIPTDISSDEQLARPLPPQPVTALPTGQVTQAAQAAGIPPAFPETGGREVKSYTVNFQPKAGKGFVGRFAGGQRAFGMPPTPPTIDLTPTQVETVPDQAATQPAAQLPPTGFQPSARPPTTFWSIMEGLAKMPIEKRQAIAKMYAGRHGLGAALVNAFGEGWKQVNENDRARVKGELVKFYREKFKTIDPSDTKAMLKERMNLGMDTAAFAKDDKEAESIIESFSKSLGILNDTLWNKLSADQKLADKKSLDEAIKQFKTDTVGGISIELLKTLPSAQVLRTLGEMTLDPDVKQRVATILRDSEAAAIREAGAIEKSRQAAKSFKAASPVKPTKGKSKAAPAAGEDVALKFLPK